MNTVVLSFIIVVLSFIVILKIAPEALEVSFNADDIRISHKLYNWGKKAIIFKFISHNVKTNFYRARSKL